MAQDTHALVRELYDAYERRQFDRVAALLHDDIDWIIHAPINLFPFAGHRKGRSAVLATLGAIAAQYQLERYRPEIILVEGDRAAVLSDVGFLQRSSNRIIRFRLVNFLLWRNGRIIEFREFANTFDIAEQALGRVLTV